MLGVFCVLRGITLAKLKRMLKRFPACSLICVSGESVAASVLDGSTGDVRHVGQHGRTDPATKGIDESQIDGICPCPHVSPDLLQGNQGVVVVLLLVPLVPGAVALLPPSPALYFISN